MSFQVSQVVALHASTATELMYSLLRQDECAKDLSQTSCAVSAPAH